MKKILGYLCVGFLSAVVLISGVTYSANATTLYNVISDGIKIVIDGQKINPTDANGNVVEPIIYNGTTYLPVRAVANAIGKAVYWDGPNYTVYLGDMNGTLEYPTVSLGDMLSISDKVSTEYGKLTDNYGNRYDSFADDGYYGNCKLEYLTNMKYNKLKGTLYIPQGETRDGTAYIQVFADGKTIYTSPELTKTSSPIDINVNIKGYNDIIIQYVVDDLVLCLGNAGFYQ